MVQSKEPQSDAGEECLFLGHADVSTTQIYTQKRLDDLAAGMERVAFHGA